MTFRRPVVVEHGNTFGRLDKASRTLRADVPDKSVIAFLAGVSRYDTSKVSAAIVLIRPLVIWTSRPRSDLSRHPGYSAPGGRRASPRRVIAKPQVVGVPSRAAAPETAVMDTISQNKNTVTAFIQALFTKGDLGAVDEYLAENYVDHDPPIPGQADREGMRQAGAMFRAAFPDWHSDVGILVGEGDLVVEEFTASGTHQGEIFGVPASGRTVSLPGINIWRVRDGRIVERWGRLDDLGLLRQLGLAP
jgi:steroid delta-isomerase-like uncharacterized protein